MQKKRKPIEKISDVITRLQTFKETYGDLPISIRLPGLARTPSISGIRYSYDGRTKRKIIHIVPKYDVVGSANEMAGINSVTHNINDIRRLFVDFANLMLRSKELLEDFKKKSDNVKSYSLMISKVKTVFQNLYKQAQVLQKSIKSLEDFDRRMTMVINEPLNDADYQATFDHHIDEDMTDAEFAKLITDGIGDKTFVQRLSAYLDIIRKINDEISNRKRRIKVLEKRIDSDKGSSEAENAKILKKKSIGIIRTLQNRRGYIVERYDALLNSINQHLTTMKEEMAKSLKVHTEENLF